MSSKIIDSSNNIIFSNIINRNNNHNSGSIGGSTKIGSNGRSSGVNTA